MRPLPAVLAVLAVGAASALGALILGEYPLTGTTPLLAGVLFGLAVAEVALAAGRRALHELFLLPLVGVLALAGMAWAAWISAGRDWGYVAAEAWVGVALAPAAAGVWLVWARDGLRR